jgi:hypothetical protein
MLRGSLLSMRIIELLDGFLEALNVVLSEGIEVELRSIPNNTNE